MRVPGRSRIRARRGAAQRTAVEERGAAAALSSLNDRYFWALRASGAFVNSHAAIAPATELTVMSAAPMVNAIGNKLPGPPGYVNNTIVMTTTAPAAT